MLSDLCGYPVSLNNGDALASWDKLHMRFLAHAMDTPQHLGAVLEKAPDFATIYAVKGLFYLMLGRRELTAEAHAARATAIEKVAMNPVTEREQAYINALSEWLDGRPSGAIQQMEWVLEHYPRDTLAAKISHAIRFILGDAVGMRRSIEAILPEVMGDHPARGYMLGCHAFTLEETGEYEAAERAGRAGLDLAPDDAWGLHAVAHVHDMTARASEGLQWLDGRESAWEHCNNFRYHVWWHKALMHLDVGQTDEVLALYDHEIRKEKTDDYRDISNATSLLSRLELDGVNVGDRWEELADVSATRTEDGCLIFADLHYLLALVGGNREDATKKMMGRIRQDAKASKTEADYRMAQPGMAAAAALEAFGDGNYTSAFLNFRAARPSMQLAGGSHAQRDVFERLTIDSAIRAGYFDDASDLLKDRKDRRGGNEDGYFAARMTMLAEHVGQSDTASTRAVV